MMDHNGARDFYAYPGHCRSALLRFRTNRIGTHWIDAMKRAMATVLFLSVLFLFSGCANDTEVVTLSQTPKVVSAEPTVIQLDRPLVRMNASLSIRLTLKESWSPEPPWTSIRLHDGTSVTINASLISSKGAKYYPGIIGRGDGLDLRFNDSI